MSQLICRNSSGILMDKVYQWDTNRKIVISGIDIDEELSYQVHFGNCHTKTTYVLEPTIENNEFITEIPIELLEKPDAIDIYIYSIDTSTDETQTIAEIRLPMIRRMMPQSYISQSTSGLIKVADGFIYENGTLYLASNGVIIGTGIDINFSQNSVAVAKLRLNGTAETVIGVIDAVNGLAATVSGVAETV